jgi:hypothetical protein
VIGSNRKRLSRGERKGIVTSETDTPEQRAAKWVQLQSGQVDVVILSFDALGRTKMNQQAVVDYIDKVEAVRRSINAASAQPEEAGRAEVKEEKLSERDAALLQHGVAPGSPRPCACRRATRIRPRHRAGTSSASTC